MNESLRLLFQSSIFKNEASAALGLWERLQKEFVMKSVKKREKNGIN